MKANGPFAFVCYDVRGGVVKAIGRINGVRWEGKEMRVKESKYNRLVENGGYKAGGRVREAVEGPWSKESQNLRTTMRKISTRGWKGNGQHGRKKKSGSNVTHETKRAAKSEYYS
ncbi:hypothetical protein PIB30_031831 [Stylosanthes scabra]|uniref:RRM domain-containing protein n=1 Tax=Stylosanthes scabra TaxID=79078 RepID=A0ABU6RC51_9FABA|nr:hypothetical protein [Stylosanthes scabra]